MEKCVDGQMIKFQANPTDWPQFAYSSFGGEKRNNMESITAFFNMSETHNVPTMSGMSIVK